MTGISRLYNIQLKVKSCRHSLIIALNYDTALKKLGPFHHFKGNIMFVKEPHTSRKSLQSFVIFNLLPPFTEPKIFIPQVAESIEY